MKRMCKKGLSLVLAWILFCSCCGMLFSLNAFAGTNGHSQGEAVAWVNSQVGKALDYDGAYGAQCVDLTCYYYIFLGSTAPRGNANQYGNGGAFCPSGWSYQGSPRAGDIAVWTGGAYGHVAIVTEIRGSKMVCVEQNYNGLQYCTANLHSIDANTYIRPDFPTDTTPPTISNVQVTNRTVDGYTVTCTVSDNVGVVKAQFPTWTAYNGQDDLIWHTGTISGNTASFRVLRSAHNNEMESYITDIYVWDAAGNETAYKSVWVNMNAYTVSYNANGGSGAPGSQTKLHDVNLTLSTTKPTRSGYTFKNWNTKSDGTGTSYSAGGTYKANAAVTLYAQWTMNATLVSLAVKTLPTKTTYDVGEKFSASGLTLTATYSDGSTQTVSKGYACTGFSSDMAGTKTITVFYDGQSTTFTVTVVGSAVTIEDFRQERTEHYKTSVRFYAGTQKAPANATVHWFVNGTDVGTGSEYTVRQPKEDYTVQTKLLDESGQIVAESETETVHIRHDLWSRLRALILWLFGVDYVIAQREEGPFSMPVENA